jgi:hypothetical protein
MKFNTCGMPQANTYQRNRLDIFVKLGKLPDAPLFIGEWNNINAGKRESINKKSKIIFKQFQNI